MNNLFSEYTLHSLYRFLIFASIIGCSGSLHKPTSGNLDPESVSLRLNDSLSLGTFTDLPDEIEGCGGYFSLTESDNLEGKYIFVDDYDKLGFISLNGNMVKLELKEHNATQKNKEFYIYANQNINLRIEIKKKVSEGEESYSVKGKIIISSKNGKSLEYKFTGTSGC